MFLCSIWISWIKIILIRYANSASSEHARHMDLLKNFTNAPDTIFEGKLIEIYNDGSSINLY